MAADQQNNTMVRLGGLWTNHGKSGDYLAGNLGQARILIFENTRRNGDNEPTHTMFIVPNEKRDDAGDGTRSTSHSTSRPVPAIDAPKNRRAGYVPCSEPDGSVDESSIPF